jgi:hypothetical protein
MGDATVKQSVKNNFLTQITREITDVISVPLKQSEVFARL